MNTVNPASLSSSAAYASPPSQPSQASQPEPKSVVHGDSFEFGSDYKASTITLRNRVNLSPPNSATYFDRSSAKPEGGHVAFNNGLQLDWTNSDQAQSKVTVSDRDGNVMSSFQGKVAVSWQTSGASSPTVDVQSGNADEKITGGGIDERSGEDTSEVYLDEVANPHHSYYESPDSPQGTDHAVDSAYYGYGKDAPGPGAVSNGGSLLTYHDTPTSEAKTLQIPVPTAWLSNGYFRV